MNTIQHLVFPNGSDNTLDNMFFRGEKVRFVMGHYSLCMGSEVSFDTYFNSLSVKTWVQDCGLNRFSYTVQGNGEALLKVIHYDLENGETLLHVSKYQLSESPISVHLDLSEIPRSGIVYAKLIALSDLTIREASWQTPESPRREVRIGVVITHFNRQEVVKTTIESLRHIRQLKDKLSIVIVDNSKSLGIDSDRLVTVIPNNNLGGSGGFMRGLCFLKENKKATHALFMDDDATCNLESIMRTHNILSYLVDGEQCIAGTLMKEEHPNLIHERGGIYRNSDFVTSYAWYDMFKVNDIVASEEGDSHLNYGAWCYFAFPLSEAKLFALPFFIHGDDVLFSICNRLKITTHLGIFANIDDFVGKESPFRVYLDTRNYMIITMLLNDSITPHIKRYSRAYLNYLFSHQYDNVYAMRRGLRDAYKASWFEDIEEPSKLFNQTSDLKNNVFKPVDLKNISNFKYCRSNRESLGLRVSRFLTIGGLLIPHKNKTVVCRLNIDNWRPYFYYKTFLFYHENSKRGYFAKYSLFKYVKLLLLGLWDFWSIRRNFHLRKRNLMKEVDYLMTEAFWRKVFGDFLE